MTESAQEWLAREYADFAFPGKVRYGVPRVFEIGFFC